MYFRISISFISNTLFFPALVPPPFWPFGLANLALLVVPFSLHLWPLVVHQLIFVDRLREAIGLPQFFALIFLPKWLVRRFFRPHTAFWPSLHQFWHVHGLPLLAEYGANHDGINQFPFMPLLSVVLCRFHPKCLALGYSHRQLPILNLFFVWPTQLRLRSVASKHFLLYQANVKVSLAVHS